MRAALPARRGAEAARQSPSRCACGAYEADAPRRQFAGLDYLEPLDIRPGLTFTETPVLIFGATTIGLIAGFT